MYSIATCAFVRGRSSPHVFSPPRVWSHVGMTAIWRCAYPTISNAVKTHHACISSQGCAPGFAIRFRDCSFRVQLFPAWAFLLHPAGLPSLMFLRASEPTQQQRKAVGFSELIRSPIVLINNLNEGLRRVAVSLPLVLSPHLLPVDVSA